MIFLQGLPSQEDASEPERFPSLLSASMRSNVFNPDFLNLVVENEIHERAQAHMKARGLESRPSVAQKVSARVPGLFDDAVGRAVDEELGTNAPGEESDLIG
jgi:hypothetical protein